MGQPGEAWASRLRERMALNGPIKARSFTSAARRCRGGRVARKRSGVPSPAGSEPFSGDTAIAADTPKVFARHGGQAEQAGRLYMTTRLAVNAARGATLECGDMSPL
jgi:hypothetical protein